VPIGRWVLGEACRQMSEWEQRYPGHAGLSVSVNISSRQFSQPGLFESVRRALDGAALHPKRLKLEMTESALVEDPVFAERLLTRLSDMGIELLIDDFGTGYSSLSYLHTFPIDTLKIDRSFIARMAADGGKDFEIVRSTISLAHNLDMRVIAEGVETPDQVEQLRLLDCECAQGWHYARALDAERAEAFLAQLKPQLPASEPVAADPITVDEGSASDPPEAAAVGASAPGASASEQRAADACRRSG
jgi:EAL domain-containing protein (putative c-di-GMP-specific phosphodiesterase class I)